MQVEPFTISGLAEQVSKGEVTPWGASLTTLQESARHGFGSDAQGTLVQVAQTFALLAVANAMVGDDGVALGEQFRRAAQEARL